MGQEKNAENIPFLRSTQPKSTERVPVVELSGFQAIMRRIGSRPTLFLILGFSDPAASGTGRKKIPEALMSRREKSTQ